MPLQVTRQPRRRHVRTWQWPHRAAQRWGGSRSQRWRSTVLRWQVHRLLAVRCLLARLGADAAPFHHAQQNASAWCRHSPLRLVPAGDLRHLLRRGRRPLRRNRLVAWPTKPPCRGLLGNAQLPSNCRPGVSVSPGLLDDRTLDGPCQLRERSQQRKPCQNVIGGLDRKGQIRQRPLTVVNRSCVTRSCHEPSLCRAAGVVQWTVGLAAERRHTAPGVKSNAPSSLRLSRRSKMSPWTLLNARRSAAGRIGDG